MTQDNAARAADLAPDLYPDPNKEIEGKYVVPSRKALTKMCKAIARLSANQAADIHVSRTYTLQHEKDYLLKSFHFSTAGIKQTVFSMNPVMKSNPVSWYWCHLDESGKVKEHDTTTRTRLSFVGKRLLDYFQHCVKGPELGHEISFVSNRDEFELENEFPIFSSDYFNEGDAHTMARQFDKGDVCLGFATNVDRNMLGLIVELGEKRALIEVAFDRISYVAPRKTEHKAGKTLVEMGKEFQIELEYKHPVDKHFNYTPMAKHLRLSLLTTDEMSEALQKVTDLVHSIANEHNIDLHGETQSKSERGAEMLNGSTLAKALPIRDLDNNDVMRYYKGALEI